jgi:hypothetical protein
VLEFETKSFQTAAATKWVIELPSILIDYVQFQGGNDDIAH